MTERSRATADSPSQSAPVRRRGAAIFVVHGLADQHRAGRPLAAEAEAVPGAQPEELLEIRRERRET
jgi:hypothetical protein